jgi:hypothetical protein
MRFTWIEGACILTIAIAAVTQSGDRGGRLSASPAQAAQRTTVVADLKPSQRQSDLSHERNTGADR